MTQQRTRRALVIGGGGMLTRCAEALVTEGWHVVLPCRSYHPLSVCPEAGPEAGKALWVQARWTEPAALADKAAAALEHPAELVVAWLPGRHRLPVLRAVARLLTGDAAVVEVYSSGSLEHGLPEAALPDHATQRVALGYVAARSGAGKARHINHAEASGAIQAAVERAIRGAPPEIDQIGEPAAWAGAGRF